ncbi:MAG: DUF4142 domain-containing protein [Limisphaerales bacterium]
MKLIKTVFVVSISIATVMAFADVETPLTPQQFVWKAGVAGMKEVCLGKIALQKSQDTAVRNFARRMVRDHSRANKKLMEIANQEDLSCPPTNTFSMMRVTSEAAGNPNVEAAPFTSSAGPGTNNLKGAEVMMLELQSPTNTDLLAVERLESLPEPEFDLAYANQAVEDHVEAVGLFAMASTTLTDEPLKQFAKKTLPTLREHYSMALDLQSKMNGMQTNSTVYPYPYPAGSMPGM